MNRDELIKKWLDHNLSTEEQRAFEQLEDYHNLIKMNQALEDFKSPEFSVDNSYHGLKSKIKSNSKPTTWIRPLLKVAAIFIIGLSLYYYTTTLDSKFNTSIAEQTIIELPDASTVDLNSNSILTFNKNKWSDNRVVKLKGEAFFKVAKGQKFDVITEHGIISVLGTKFNVKQRGAYFEVTCYEGLVSVTHNNKTIKLKPQDSYKNIDGKLFAAEKENATQPNWLRGESSFEDVPLKYVLSELKNQYDIEIKTDNIDTSRLFTGTFTHKNLDLALQSVTIPLNLGFNKSGNIIRIARE
jgi:ferric-dicitrate binding protein FerR (iron transport regulator)